MAEVGEEEKMEVYEAAAKLSGLKSLQISDCGKCALPTHLIEGRLSDCTGSYPVNIDILPYICSICQYVGAIKSHCMLLWTALFIRTAVLVRNSRDKSD